jgi:hypothetical protein
MAIDNEFTPQSHTQRLIELGVLHDLPSLEQHVLNQGWKLKNVKTDQAHVELPTGQKFKLDFKFNQPVQEYRPDSSHTARPRAPQESGIRALAKYATRGRVARRTYVYILMAENQAGMKAAYIGSTATFRCRMEDHLLQTHGPGRASSDLFKWAAKYGATVTCAVLDYTDIVGMGESLEGLWVQRATRANFHLPGAERWASQLPRHSLQVVQEIDFPPKLSTLKSLVHVLKSQSRADDMYVGLIDASVPALLRHRRTTS